MAAAVSPEFQRHVSALVLVIDIYPDIIKAMICNKCPPPVIKIWLNGDFGQKLVNTLSKDQTKLVNAIEKDGYRHFDTDLMYKICRHFGLVTQPTRGWGNKPESSHVNQGDDVERMRYYRNAIIHRSRLSLTEKETEDLFAESAKIALRIDNELGNPSNGFEQKIKNAQQYAVCVDSGNQYLRNCAEYIGDMTFNNVRQVRFYIGGDIKCIIENNDNAEDKRTAAAGLDTVANTFVSQPVSTIQRVTGDEIVSHHGLQDKKTKEEELETESTHCVLYVRDPEMKDIQEIVRLLDNVKENINQGTCKIKLVCAKEGSLVIYVIVYQSLTKMDCLYKEIVLLFSSIFELEYIDKNCGKHIDVVLAESDYSCIQDQNDILPVTSESDLKPTKVLKMDVIVHNSSFQSVQALHGELNSFVNRIANSVDLGTSDKHGSFMDVFMTANHKEKDVPSQPIGPLEISNDCKKQATLSWELSQNNGGSPITENIIKTREIWKSTYTEDGKMKPYHTTLELTERKEGEEYFVQPKGVNILGQSKPLESVTCFNAKIPNQQSDNDFEAGNELRIVLIGKTGSGKSATGNLILGGKHFDTLVSGSSVTPKCKRGETLEKGKKIMVVDTPGLFDTGMTNNQITTEINKCIGMTSPGPHAMVLVVGIGRITIEEQDTVKHFVAHFGEGMFKYMIVLFTRKEDLTKTNQSIHQFVHTVPQYLKTILKQCSNRYIAFNNDAIDPERETQRGEFFDMVDKMLESNGHSCYTNEIYKEAEAMLQRRMRQKRENLEQQRRQEETELRLRVESKFNKELEHKIQEKIRLEEELKSIKNEMKKAQDDKDKMTNEMEILKEQARLQKELDEIQRRHEKEKEKKDKKMSKLLKQKEDEYKVKMKKENLRQEERDEVENENQHAPGGIINLVTVVAKGVHNFFAKLFK